VKVYKGINYENVILVKPNISYDRVFETGFSILLRNENNKKIILSTLFVTEWSYSGTINGVKYDQNFVDIIPKQDNFKINATKTGDYYVTFAYEDIGSKQHSLRSTDADEHKLVASIPIKRYNKNVIIHQSKKNKIDKQNTIEDGDVHKVKISRTKSNLHTRSEPNKQTNTDDEYRLPINKFDNFNFIREASSHGISFDEKGK